MDPFAARRNQFSPDCSSSAYSGKRSYEYLADVAQNSYDCPTCSSAGDLAEQLDNIMNFNELLPPKSKRIRTGSDFSRPPGIWHVPDPAPVESEKELLTRQPSPPRHREKSQRRRQRGRGSGSQSIPNGEVPHATEEEWARRAIKRSDPVNNVKASTAYLDNQGYTPRPQTPNPSKRISKRDWETEVAEWRSDWRAIDGVRKLVDMGFEEIASCVAWRESKLNDQPAHDQEAHLERAIALLTVTIGE